MHEYHSFVCDITDEVVWLTKETTPQPTDLPNFGAFKWQCAQMFWHFNLSAHTVTLFISGYRCGGISWCGQLQLVEQQEAKGKQCNWLGVFAPRKSNLRCLLPSLMVETECMRTVQSIACDIARKA